MTSGAVEETKQSPWYMWPGEWRRDEKFWREVATRTIAGVFALWIVATVASLAVVIGGFLSKPESWAILILGTGLVVTGLFWVSTQSSRSCSPSSIKTCAR